MRTEAQDWDIIDIHTRPGNLDRESPDEHADIDFTDCSATDWNLVDIPIQVHIKAVRKFISLKIQIKKFLTDYIWKIRKRYLKI